MAGVLELIRLIGPKRQLSVPSERISQASSKALELQAAMEILSEVFGLRISEVEEMLLERGKAKAQLYGANDGLWPESFIWSKCPAPQAAMWNSNFSRSPFQSSQTGPGISPEGSLQGFAHLSAHGEPGRRELQIAES